MSWRWSLLLFAATSLHAGFLKVAEGEIVNDGGWCYGCAWADYDGNGFPDLFVTNNNAGQHKSNFLYLNNGDGTFLKILEGPIVGDSGSSYGCTWADYDNDGHPDLFVSNYGENNCLYHNNGDSTFTKILDGPVVNDGGRSTGASWADYDRDGWLDLFVCNRNQVNFLYHGNGDGTFTRILAGEIASDLNNSSGCAWADYDDDGYPDLLVANVQTPNCLYHNNGDGSFSRVRTGPIANDTSFCNGVSWVDWDNDGDFDVLVTTGVLGTYHDLLYRNDGGGVFGKVTGTAIDTPFTWSGGGGWADFDNDADMDLLVGGYDGANRLFENDEGVFVKLDTGALATDGNYIMGIAWADYDRDGWQDIFTARNNYFGGNSCLYHNEGGLNHWLNVRCVGTVSNRSAIGVRVRVRADIGGQTVWQLREISAQTGGGNSGQSPFNVGFGLGDANIVDSLVVSWPSGIVQVVTGVNNDQFLVVTEGASSVRERSALTRTPRRSVLGPASPNPFSDCTSISYSRPGTGRSDIAVYNAAGKLVRRLVCPAEASTVVWDGKDARGRRLSSGIYLIQPAGGTEAPLRVIIAR